MNLHLLKLYLMKDRITQFLINENISSAEFADKIGVQRSSVSHILNGRNFPSTSFIQKMLSAYTDLNPKWLLLGEGSMFGSVEIVSKEPSLFPYSQENHTASSGNHERKNERNPDKPLITNEIPINKKTDLESVKSQIQSEERSIPERVTQQNDNFKDVERIILFHKDKTFTEYTPSK